MVSKYISLVYWTAALVWLQSGRKENIVLKWDIRGARCVCIGAECKRLQKRWWGALRFEWADPGTEHRSQIHRLAGHLQEDAAGGLLSPWKHWLDQGYIGANYRTVSLGGPIYWKMVRGVTASVHWARSHIQYALHCWLHYEWSQLRNSYKRAGPSGKRSNILAAPHLRLAFLSPYYFSIPLSCSLWWVLASFSA